MLLSIPGVPGPEGKSSPRDPMFLFSFGIITDVHYCNREPEGSRFYTNSSIKLRKALNNLKADSVEFLINLGDIIDRDFESFKPVLDIIDSSGLPVYHVVGNHDYSVEKRFKRKIPVQRHSGNKYYSFVQGNIRFIALDGNEVSVYASGSRKTTSDALKLIEELSLSGRENAMDWNGGISGKQLQWLKLQLDESVSRNEKVIILCHFPVYPDNMHNLLNSDKVLSLLGKYQNVVAWFNGHNHSGNYGNFNMIHFVTLKGMVETSNTGSHARVDVYRNKIWITGSGREKSQILAY